LYFLVGRVQSQGIWADVFQRRAVAEYVLDRFGRAVALRGSEIVQIERAGRDSWGLAPYRQ